MTSSPEQSSSTKTPNTTYTVSLRDWGARSALDCGGKRQRHAAFGRFCGRAGASWFASAPRVRKRCRAAACHRSPKRSALRLPATCSCKSYNLRVAAHCRVKNFLLPRPGADFFRPRHRRPAPLFGKSDRRLFLAIVSPSVTGLPSIQRCYAPITHRPSLPLTSALSRRCLRQNRRCRLPRSL